MDEAQAAPQDLVGTVSRRAVNLGAVWSVPAVMAAVAAPAAKASPPLAAAKATLGGITGEKGEVVGLNRLVYFTFSFSAVTGSNTIQLKSATGGPWTNVGTPGSPLPTPSLTFTGDAKGMASVTFTLQRPDNNSATVVDVTYVLNGTTATQSGVAIKNKARG